VNRARSIFTVLSLALVFTGCSILEADEDETPPIEIVTTELGDMSNISVCGDVWLGEVPSKNALDIAHRRGIRTLISLLPTGAPADRIVAEESRRLGIAFVPIGIDKQTPDDRDVDRVVEALQRKGRGPVLMYCESGSQAMMFFAIYRAAFDGISVESALEAARRGGMKPGRSEFVRAQVERLRP
jgi:protein tyrosine phosphatase (PTP) superfamily phosphohydrolase (DUF442 family)